MTETKLDNSKEDFCSLPHDFIHHTKKNDESKTLEQKPWAGDVTQSVEYLPRIRKVLGSVPSTV